MITILLATDESGPVPLLLREGDALPRAPFRWRLVAETDDEGLAERLMALLARRCLSEPPARA
jgi:hypothetical protein